MEDNLSLHVLQSFHIEFKAKIKITDVMLKQGRLSSGAS